MRRAVLVVTTVLALVLGPRLSAPRDRAAGEAFAYEPPDGFTEVSGAAKLSDQEKEWVHVPSSAEQIAPRIMLKRTRSGGTVDPAALAAIASGMPDVLRPSGVTWTDVRHETRTRPDGARVGLIEGDCVNDKGVEYRRLFFVFPTDEGTAITTALYGKDEISKWQPVLEATLVEAHGVALRVPPPPNWMYLAWGGAGLVMGWLASSLVDSTRANRRAERKDAT